MSQKKFADMVGINYHTYKSKELGKSDWKVSELKKIAENLQVKITDLIIN